MALVTWRNSSLPDLFWYEACLQAIQNGNYDWESKSQDYLRGETNLSI